MSNGTEKQESGGWLSNFVAKISKTISSFFSRDPQPSQNCPPKEPEEQPAAPAKTDEKKSEPAAKPKKEPQEKQPEKWKLTVLVKSTEAGKWPDQDVKVSLKVIQGGSGTESRTVSMKSDLGSTKQPVEGQGQRTYEVTASVDKWTLESPAQVSLNDGETKDVTLRISPPITVEPKLELEYKVVLLDRKLSDHQDAKEEKYFADPTCIQVSAVQSKSEPKFTKGAMLKAAPASVEVFTDEKCEAKDKLDLSKPIPNDKLMGAQPWKLWLKGKTKGKFDLTLDLEDPGDARIVKKEKVKEEMGVVEIEMKIHQHDIAAVKALEINTATDTLDQYFTNLKNKALPDQKALTDEQKVKDGRLLHVQNGHHFGRAKLLIKKLDAGQWPAGTDDYQIVLDPDGKNPSGSIAIQDKEWDGAAVAFPVKIKVSDLKAADKEYWVEGAGETKKLRDVRLELQLDRPAGGMAKEVKHNADWARFTVIKIKEVKIEYKAEAGKAVAWDEAKQEFYINLQAEPAGRKVTISAQLSEKLKDVDLYFMLAPDKDNTKSGNNGLDLPGTWKWKDIKDAIKQKDKDGPKKLLHISAKTDDKGYAKVELTLSRFGGDKFEPAAYLEQDPHLAKYVRGHADLGKKKPVVCDKTMTVSRKFWYQVVKVEGINVPGMAGAEGQYTRVKASMTKCDDLDVTRATVNGFNPKAIYPMYMVKLNGGDNDALVVSDSNKAQFFTGFAAEADKPIKIPILVCDAQWDEGGDSGAVSANKVPAANFPIDIEVDKLVLTPPLQGGDLLVSGDWTAAEWDAAANAGAGGWVNVRNGTLSNANLSINKTRNSLSKVTVALPAGVGATTAQTSVWIQNLIVQGANGPYLGESFNRRILAVYESDTQLKRDDFQNTIAHEIGHAFYQVIKNAKASAMGVPNHPIAVDLGQGNHCRHATNKCVMYDSGPIAGSLNRYCDICHPYLVVQDMTSIS